MKVAITLVALFFVSVSGSHYGSTKSGGHEAGQLGESGTSSQYREQDNYGKYEFGYDEQHTSGGSNRHEKGDGYGGVTGSYGLNDADGRRRVVYYVADNAGFRAKIQSNEPGVGHDNPADVSIHKEQEPESAHQPAYGQQRQQSGYEQQRQESGHEQQQSANQHPQQGYGQQQQQSSYEQQQSSYEQQQEQEQQQSANEEQPEQQSYGQHQQQQQQPSYQGQRSGYENQQQQQQQQQHQQQPSYGRKEPSYNGQQQSVERQQKLTYGQQQMGYGQDESASGQQQQPSYGQEQSGHPGQRQSGYEHQKLAYGQQHQQQQANYHSVPRQTIRMSTRVYHPAQTRQAYPSGVESYGPSSARSPHLSMMAQAYGAMQRARSMARSSNGYGQQNPGYKSMPTRQSKAGGYPGAQSGYMQSRNY